MEAGHSNQGKPNGHNAANRRPLVRPKVVLLIVVALSACALAFWHFYLHLPTGSGPAGPAVPREPFGRVWHEGQVELLGVGDSITAGYGATTGFSYFDRLASTPEGDWPEMRGLDLAAVFPELAAKNISLSGSTSIEHLEMHVGRLETRPPDVFGVVVITTGGNDIIHDYGRRPPREGAMYGATLAQARPWIDNFETRLDDILIGLEAAYPGGCEVFLANIYDPTDGSGDTGLTGLPAWPDAMEVLAAYNAIIAGAAAKHDFVHLVDIRGPFLGHGLHCTKWWNGHYRFGDATYWYFPNIEDPNDRGYDAIRRLFLLEMIDVFATGEQ
jgi:lysophospholipase L1-like esterase